MKFSSCMRKIVAGRNASPNSLLACNVDFVFNHEGLRAHQVKFLTAVVEEFRSRLLDDLQSHPGWKSTVLTAGSNIFQTPDLELESVLGSVSPESEKVLQANGTRAGAMVQVSSDHPNFTKHKAFILERAVIAMNESIAHESLTSLSFNDIVVPRE